MLRFGGIERCLWLQAMLMLRMMLAAGGTFLQSGCYVAFRIVLRIGVSNAGPLRTKNGKESHMERTLRRGRN